MFICQRGRGGKKPVSGVKLSIFEVGLFKLNYSTHRILEGNGVELLLKGSVRVE